MSESSPQSSGPIIKTSKADGALLPVNWLTVPRRDEDGNVVNTEARRTLTKQQPPRVVLRKDEKGTYIHVEDTVYTMEELESTFTREQCLELLAEGIQNEDAVLDADGPDSNTNDALAEKTGVEGGGDRFDAATGGRGGGTPAGGTVDDNAENKDVSSLVLYNVRRMVHGFGGAFETDDTVALYLTFEVREFIRELFDDLCVLGAEEARKKAELAEERAAKRRSEQLAKAAEAAAAAGTTDAGVEASATSTTTNATGANELDDATHSEAPPVKKAASKSKPRPRLALRHIRMRFANLRALQERVTTILRKISSARTAEAQMHESADADADTGGNEITPDVAVAIFGGGDESTVLGSWAANAADRNDEANADNDGDETALCTQCSNLVVPCRRCCEALGVEPRSLRRLDYRSRISQAFSTDEYLRFVECTTASLTRPLDSFKAWVDLQSGERLPDFVFTKEVLDIVGELGADWLEDVVRTLVERDEHDRGVGYTRRAFSLEDIQNVVEELRDRWPSLRADEVPVLVEAGMARKSKPKKKASTPRVKKSNTGGSKKAKKSEAKEVAVEASESKDGDAAKEEGGDAAAGGVEKSVPPALVPQAQAVPSAPPVAPPKKKPEVSKASSDSQPTRKRGRPRKSDSATASGTECTEPPLKKKRGRPPKDPSAPPKKRGRPRKHPLPSDEAVAVAVAVAAVADVGANVQVPAVAAEAKASVDAEPVKRKRGRPRKYPVGEEPLVVAKSEVKRKRGRPRKHPLPVPTEAAANNVSSVVPLDVVDDKREEEIVEEKKDVIDGNKREESTLEGVDSGMLVPKADSLPGE